MTSATDTPLDSSRQIAHASSGSWKLLPSEYSVPAQRSGGVGGGVSDVHGDVTVMYTIVQWWCSW